MKYLKFKRFIIEKLLVEKHSSQLTKLAHLEHIEDYIFNEGGQGIKQAIEFLDNLHDVMKGNSSSKIITQSKWDGCLHEDTVLQTSDGLVTIGDIIKYKKEKEYLVYTHNFENNKDEYQKAMIPRITGNHKKWIKLILEDDTEIILTEDHEVYTNNRGWVEAKNLNEHDDIKDTNKIG